jgi:two-component system chemotaxis sensor kinase CheA
MAITPDQSAFIDIFKAEATDYIATLQQGLLVLEKNPNQPTVIDEMFRAAHTLKGCSRMMGFMDIQEIAHHLEDLFGVIKDKQLALSPEITNQALKGLDAITAIMEAVTRGQSADTDIKTICSALARATARPVASPEPAEPSGPNRAANGGSNGSKPAPVPQPAPTVTHHGKPDELIRIPVSRIDALFNLIGELVVHKVKASHRASSFRRLAQQTTLVKKRMAPLTDLHGQGTTGDTIRAIAEFQAAATEQQRQIFELSESYGTEEQHLDPVIDELQYRVREMRLLPCSTIFDSFERLVRDVAQQEKREVRLVVEGEETQLDKKVLDVIKPCLVHLLRNAVDHGVEQPDDREAHGKPRQATIWLRASQQGGSAVIEVQDDGRGIDLDTIRQVARKKRVMAEAELDQLDDDDVRNLIFAPGFSTSPIITEISGRGVGMDVVRREVEQLRGTISVKSTPQVGTTITISLPLDVAIMKILLVHVNQQQFGLPLLAVEEILRVKTAELHSLKGRLAIPYREKILPVVPLADILGVPRPETNEERKQPTAPSELPLVILKNGDRRVGFLVDQVANEEELFIKSLPQQLGAIRNVSGASLMATGDVVVILDAADLIASARKGNTVASASIRPQESVAKRRILIAEDSMTTREFERHLLESHGYDVDTAVDGVDGLDKLLKGQYDLVVSDVQMPRMDGFEFCRNIRLRPDCNELPVIFVTTLDRDEEKRKGIEVGAQAYIVKGAFDQTNLLQTIDRLIG